jgi:hypothetical protein
MSYQVVNPATGEIAVVVGSEGSRGLENFSMCRRLCDELHKKEGERWDVLHIEIVYSTDGDYTKARRGEHGSEPRSSGADR